MKILFITDLIPIKPDETTTPVTLHNFVFNWQKQGHEVTVIRPNFILNSVLRKKTIHPTGFYENNGVKIFNVNYITPFWFTFLNKIPEAIKLANYDFVIGHMPSGIIFANKFAQCIQKTLVCGVHCSDIEVLTNPLYGFYFKSQMKKAYKNAKKIACRSIILRKKFIKLLPEYAHKTFIAGSGIPSETINNAVVLPNSFESKKINVVTCANLIKRKNVDKLVYALKDLDDFDLKVIGDGPELKNLTKIKAKNVKLLGRLSHDKVINEMKKSDIFVLPSVNETFGMVYLESMASGCVTVCTKKDGVDGIIKDGENGFLCEPTIEGIQKTLLKIKNFENIDLVIKSGIETAMNNTQEKSSAYYLDEIQK